MTDFGQIKNYAGYIKEDPFRRGLHFPAVEQILGDLSKKRILDIGCGDGLFPRLLAERGASVVGYDKAPEIVRWSLPLDAVFSVLLAEYECHRVSPHYSDGRACAGLRRNVPALLRRRCGHTSPATPGQLLP